ncbi:MAG TPA: hypothetical protein DCW29_16035 [Janthinobacterium sp.]|nr:hypothetical protein [Janthinobacterium sp.]
MRTTIKHLGAACAGAMLMACAGGGQPLADAPAGPTADGYYILGRADYAARRYAEALRAYRQALRVDPGHVNARNGLAVLYAGQGDYARAIALWRELTVAAEGATPARAFLFRNLGHAYLLAGEREHAMAALEKACVLDPLDAQAWEQLGRALEQDGQGERAALMFRQAQSLREHAAAADYALLASAPAPATVPAPAPAAPAPGAWPADLPRTELIQSGGLVELRRAPSAAAAASPPVVAPAAALGAGARPLRLEISNGNGVAGMAAALARTLAGPRLQVTRLGNEQHFQVARTRVEYGPRREAAARELAAGLGPLVALVPSAAIGADAADLRLVLGRDLLDPATLHRYYLRQLELARNALARLG